MLQEITTGVPSIVAFKISGKLELKDFEHGKSVIEAAIEKCGRISCVIEASGIELPGLKFFKEDLSFIYHHAHSIERFAIIGDKTWEKIWFSIVSSIVPFNAKFFAVANKDEAWQWIKKEV
ncbi:MAG: STAS/SEC14 domain-containing protein [Victivallaceae bacterium]